MVITSLLDTDLYKFTMMQAVLHQFPSANVTYQFKCRNSDVSLGHLAEAVRDEIDALATLSIALHEERFRGLPRTVSPEPQIRHCRW